MRIVRHRVIDWEPLALALVGDGLRADDIERFTRRWQADRQTAGICGCKEKSLSVSAVREGVAVDCEWMCERCLADFLGRLQAQFSEVREVRVGIEEPERAAVDRSDKAAFVAVAEKHVEMEDGRRVLVPPFQIARRAVTTADFLQFIESTGYETTAQKLGRADTFMDHPAMPPFERERIVAPVQCVSFYDAQAYCRWKTKVRLPTEYEWLSASIVDERVYDKWADRELVYDAEGRLRQGSLPNALQQLGCEWTSTTTARDTSVVRCGPIFVRFAGWERKSNRRLTPKGESSLMVGFRVVLEV